MLEIGMILLMGVFAWLTIHSHLLRLSVVYMAIFSLLAAFVFVFHGAPELAIAEAVIGSGLVTLLYLVALQRYRVYTICVASDRHSEALSDSYIKGMENNEIVHRIRRFCMSREFEPEIVFSSKSVKEAMSDSRYDLVITHENGETHVYGPSNSYVIVELELMFQMDGANSGIRFGRYTREGL